MWGGGDRHYEVIDYLKGFSIFTIVVMHLLQAYMTKMPSIISKLATIGGTGVHIFIFCSGFGLYLGYVRHPKTYADFIKSRFNKLYIPYILVVVISFFIPWMYTGSDRGVALLSHIFLFKMFVPKYEGSFGDQLWFMSTIFQLYLVFIPLCHLKEKLKNTKAFLALAGIISVAWWVAMAVTGKAEVRSWGSFFLQYLWEFCLGMAAAEFMRDHDEVKISVQKMIAVAFGGISLSALAVFGGKAFTVFNDVPALFGYGALALIIYYMSFLNKFILFISQFSYEWYLVHILVFTVLFRIPVSSFVGQNILGCIAMMLSMLVAWGYSMIFKNVKEKNQIENSHHVRGQRNANF